MIKDDSIFKQLERARQATIKEASSATKQKRYSDKTKWEVKRDFLTDLINEFKKFDDSHIQTDTVFISFSHDKLPYFDLLKDKLKEQGIIAINGFEDSQDNRDTVTKNVLSQIKSSSMYVGIMSKELTITNCDDEGNCYMPSIWTMEEKGMAFGLKKPFLLVIEKGVHKDFWRKTAPMERHIFFDGYEGYKSMLDQITDKIIDKISRLEFQKQRENLF